jgi:hypothetical protein
VANRGDGRAVIGSIGVEGDHYAVLPTFDIEAIDRCLEAGWKAVAMAATPADVADAGMYVLLVEETE